jgi:UDP-N-acetylglucosamine:LPS N-acetylglucosamine transferase
MPVFSVHIIEECKWDPRMLQRKVLPGEQISALDSPGCRPKLLAISSGGGHWVQLLRIKQAFENCEVVFVTVHDSYRAQVPNHTFYTVNDANRWNKIALLKAARRLAGIIWKEKPDVVVSTGAAPGYLALRIGHLMGARTIWLDSIANVEQLSMSGFRIGHCADLWLTQWPHLARPEGPHYAGSVL